MLPRRKLLVGIYTLIAIVLIGTGGYVLIEGWTFFDALYMAVITITTVGYAEIHPLSTGGRIFTIFLIVGGVGGALYALSGLIEFVVEGNLKTNWWRRRMEANIEKLKGHLILCGYGQVGEEIAHTFKEEEAYFVIIDNNPETINRAEQAGYLCLLGDATNDEILKKAGIEQARGLVIAIDNDASNTYITLSARQLHQDIFIETRASSKEAEEKLRRAGADRIILPYRIGAHRMAMQALRPGVVDFVDTVIYSHGKDLQLENIIIDNDSALVGQSVSEARQCSQANILAIHKKNHKLLANPSGKEVIEAGDQVIIMGTREQLTSLENVCEGVKLNE